MERFEWGTTLETEKFLEKSLPFFVTLPLPNERKHGFVRKIQEEPGEVKREETKEGLGK